MYLFIVDTSNEPNEPIIVVRKMNAKEWRKRKIIHVVAAVADNKKQLEIFIFDV